MAALAPLRAGRVQRRTLAEQIAAQIKRHILSQNLLPGSRLPSEQQLCKTFGASRVAVREALKRLEGEGLVTMRPGAAGGVQVARPSVVRIREAFTLFCQLQEVPIDALIEFRIAMERTAVRWAAERATAEDFRRLRRLVRAMESSRIALERFYELDIQFHTGIAEASKNRVFALIMHAVRHALQRAILAAHARIRDPQAMTRKLAREHREILTWLMERNPEAAEAAVTRHIQEFYAAVLWKAKTGG